MSKKNSLKAFKLRHSVTLRDERMRELKQRQRLDRRQKLRDITEGLGSLGLNISPPTVPSPACFSSCPSASSSYPSSSSGSASDAPVATGSAASFPHPLPQCQATTQEIVDDEALATTSSTAMTITQPNAWGAGSQLSLDQPQLQQDHAQPMRSASTRVGLPPRCSVRRRLTGRAALAAVSAHGPRVVKFLRARDKTLVKDKHKRIRKYGRVRRPDVSMGSD
eukprot:GHVT01064006.1.p1 GENE.GHVT01064006.1~~GHVT01064006.1.p1  ORF type:complete len:222 (+),score=37.66 GHVT01064006.1:262-927(+)